MLKLRGNLRAPQLLADLTASGLQWQALRINRVKIDGDVRSTDQIQGQLAVRVEQLKQDALEVSLLTLDAKGSEKQHQLQLKIDGKPVSGQLALQGSFDRQQQLARQSEQHPFRYAGRGMAPDARHRAGLPEHRAENQRRAALLAEPERRAVRA